MLGEREFDTGDAKKAAEVVCKLVEGKYSRPVGAVSGITNAAGAQIIGLGYYAALRNAGADAGKDAENLMEDYRDYVSLCERLLDNIIPYPEPPRPDPRPEPFTEYVTCNYNCNLLRRGTAEDATVRCIYDCNVMANQDRRCEPRIKPFVSAEISRDEDGCLFCLEDRTHEYTHWID